MDTVLVTCPDAAPRVQAETFKHPHLAFGNDLDA